VEKREVRYELRGIEIEDVPFKELAAMELEGGVRIIGVAAGKWKETGIKKGFVIAYIDKVPVDNAEDLNRILDFKKGGILVEGFYPAVKKEPTVLTGRFAHLLG